MKRIIKKIRINKKMRVGYGTAFLLLLLSYLLTLYTNKQLRDQVQKLDHTNKVIIGLSNFLSNITDAETGYRGFLIMKDRRFLDPYYTSRTQVDSVYNLLRVLTWDNPLQQARLDSLDILMNRRYALLSWGIEDFTLNNFKITPSMQSEEYHGRAIMNELRSVVSLMQIHEDKQRTARDEALNAKFSALNTIIIVSLVFAFLLLILAFITYARENKARQRADEKVRQYQEQLQQRIDELAAANTELIKMRSIEKFAATGRIARTIAHEVRNPLTNINLAIDQLKMELPDISEDSGILFDMVTRNSKRINQLITDLLNSTKFAELSYQKRSINELLDEALSLAADRIKLHNVTIQKKYTSATCNVLVDGEKIKIAILNLIVNAIEAMAPGEGVLQLETDIENGQCIIKVTDNGSGMDAEALTRLFEPYFTNKSKGAGLGLTNTQNIILNHKGVISAESEMGKGTIFIITLSLALEEGSLTSRPSYHP